MSIYDFQFDKIFGEDAFTFAGKNFEDECDADEFIESFGPEGNRIGGYASFGQEDPRERGIKYEDYGVLLLQIDSEVGSGQDNGIRWGDSGTANFFIRPEGLKNLDFNKVLFAWVCG